MTDGYGFFFLLLLGIMSSEIDVHGNNDTSIRYQQTSGTTESDIYWIRALVKRVTLNVVTMVVITIITSACAWYLFISCINP